MTDKGNYAKAAAQARRLFLEADQKSIGARNGVSEDPDYFFVRFLDAMFRVDKATGQVERSTAGGPYENASGFAPSMTVFDYLCLDRGERALSGAWVTTEHLGGNVHSNRSGGFFSKDAAFCDKHREALPAALSKLGGREMPVGDVGFALPILGELPLYFQFWASDDEFPASTVLLWDENTLRYVHYETLYYIAELFFDRLRALLNAAR